ncbi:MAG: hypothetical protein M3M98_00915, partial [Nitrospirota bacterium]|nr:hypothetical protein [Nitrospirota bacterium]
MSRELPSHVFHLTEKTNFSSIRQHGLLSTKALLDLAGVGSNERAQLERRCRLTHTELPNGVQIRDQKPLLPQALTRCLVGMTPFEWYALINSK